MASPLVSPPLTAQAGAAFPATAPSRLSATPLRLALEETAEFWASFWTDAPEPLSAPEEDSAIVLDEDGLPLLDTESQMLMITPFSQAPNALRATDSALEMIARGHSPPAVTPGQLETFKANLVNWMEHMDQHTLSPHDSANSRENYPLRMACREAGLNMRIFPAGMTFLSQIKAHGDGSYSLRTVQNADTGLIWFSPPAGPDSEPKSGLSLVRTIT